MEEFNLVGFALYVFASAFTPGPNNILSMSAAGRYGIARAWRVLVGVFAGFIIVMLLCALFSVALASLVPKIMPFMEWAGAAYILWLAWKTWRSSDAADGESDVDCGFWAGFVLEFVNVKIMLYGVTALTSFVMPAFDSTAAVAAFAVLLAAIGSVANWTWALFGVLFQRALRNHGRLFNALMALLPVYCAAGILLQTPSWAITKAEAMEAAMTATTLPLYQPAMKAAIVPAAEL